MTRAGKILASLLIAFGVVLMFVGWGTSGYLQQVLLQIGGTVLFAAPLVAVGHILSARVENIQRRTGADRIASNRPAVAAAMGYRATDEALVDFQQLLETVGVPAASVRVYVPEGDELRPAFTGSTNPPDRNASQPAPEEGAVAQAWRTGRPTIVTGSRPIRAFGLREAGSSIAVPIVMNDGQASGVLNVESKTQLSEDMQHEVINAAQLFGDTLAWEFDSTSDPD